MIKKEFLIPEFYINKRAFCDNCDVELQDTGTRLMSNPPLIVLRCSKCNKEYNIRSDELQGEWKWRTI